jgi:hypothetical protein
MALESCSPALRTDKNSPLDTCLMSVMYFQKQGSYQLYMQHMQLRSSQTVHQLSSFPRGKQIRQCRQCPWDSIALLDMALVSSSLSTLHKYNPQCMDSKRVLCFLLRDSSPQDMPCTPLRQRMHSNRGHMWSLKQE